MDTLEKFNQEVISKKAELTEQSVEELDVVKSEVANNKFNITVQNTGNLSINLTRLWVTNKTGTDQVYKYDLNVAVPPGDVATNIGQSLDLTAFDTQSYDIKLITDRGNDEEFFMNLMNLPSQEPLLMNLITTPDTLPDQFTTTVVYQVMNNMSSKDRLFNLRPQLTVSGTASADLVTNVIPSSYPTLAQGDIATFVWVYRLGGTDATTATFNATLANAKQGNWVTSTATVKVPLSALSAATTITSAGLASKLLTDNMLIMHNETNLTPAGEYQLYSGDADAGNDGKKLMLNQTNPSFFTSNGTDTVSIPTGNWIASLKLRSDAVPLSLQGDGESMIFHFEDGQGVNPDNSQGSANRDLKGCIQSQQSSIYVATGTDDATENRPGGGMDLTNSDLEFPWNGGTAQLLGFRWTGFPISQGAIINTAYINFTSEAGSVGTVNIGIWGQASDNALTFSTATSTDISSRPDTSALVAWDNIPPWSDNESGPDTKTPELKTIIQEIVNRAGWAPNNGIVIFVNNSATSPTASGNYRTIAPFEHANPAPLLYISWGSPNEAGLPPDWEATSGPHGSGVYRFNGVDDCFVSVNNVASTDANNVSSEPDTTSLWFKTDGAVSGEDYLVYWDGSGTCPTCDYYKISLNNTGRVLFQFKTSTTAGSEITTCLSANDYDDGQWYHVVAVRGDGSTDKCNLYIHALDGTQTESIVLDNSYGGTHSVDADGKWKVGTDRNSTGYLFKGWIDDIIHWNSTALTSAEADDLAKTNYGTGAHKLDFIIDETDVDGVLLQNVYTSLSKNATFKDGKALAFNDDNAYGTSVNITLASVPQIILSPGERLNFTIRYVSTPTTAWEPFNVNMTIDDETMTPQPSFVEIPMPNATLPAYFNYDNDDWLIINVTNSGTVGSWLTFAGTRVTFDDISGTTSYAGIIQRVNDVAIDPDNDSVFLPVGSRVGLNYSQPKSTPASTGTANLIPPGIYKMYIDLYGYDENGQISVRPKYVGQVLVTD